MQNVHEIAGPICHSSFDKKTSKILQLSLKKWGLKWNPFRKEWQGYIEGKESVKEIEKANGSITFLS